MKVLDGEQARTFRQIFMSRLVCLSFSQKTRVMSAFDLAINEFNKLAISTI